MSCGRSVLVVTVEVQQGSKFLMLGLVQGYGKRVLASSFSVKGRGTSGMLGIKLRDGDRLVDIHLVGHHAGNMFSSFRLVYAIQCQVGPFDPVGSGSYQCVIAHVAAKHKFEQAKAVIRS